MANDSWNRWDKIARRVEQLKETAARAETGYGDISAPDRRRRGVFGKLRLAALCIARIFLIRD